MNAEMQAQRVPFSVAISKKGYQKLINDTIQDPKRKQRFVASIVSAVAVNPALQECDPKTILSGALLGESLGLSPSPQLGQYYLVPFQNRKEGKTDAQFVIGYKGYVQLALRSGYYKRLNVLAVKEGELLSYDPLTEDVEIRLTDGELAREKKPSVGYLAMFEYHNGFRKTIYWSKEKMLAHADRYSAAFSINATTVRVWDKDARKYVQKQKVSFLDYEAGNFQKDDSWMYSSFWYKDFDGMAAKTMLRQLISKWGIMSIDLQTAFEQDTTIEDAGDYLEPDAPDALPDAPEPPQEADAEPEAGEETVNLDEL